MNLGDVKDRVKNQFGDTSGAMITDGDIIRWVNDAQLDIARKTRCLLTTAPNTSVTAGTDSYPVPADFLFLDRATYNNRYLSPIPYEQLDVVHPNRAVDSQRGTPEYIAVRGRNFVLYPVPDTTGATLRIEYYRTPVVIAVGAADSTIPDIPLAMHEDIVRFALARAKEKDDDYTTAQIIWADYQNRVNLSRSDTEWPEDSYPLIREV